MVPASERILDRISGAELKRRWAAVRREMAAHQIDALVMQSTNDWLGGYAKWFTDIPANNGYPRTIVFHADEMMTVIEMGPFGVVRDYDGGDELHRGVDQHVLSPAFPSIAYTHEFDADHVVDVIKQHGHRHVAFVGPGALPHGLVARVKARLEGAVTFNDATEIVDQIKAIKSAEEIALVRRTAAMQDTVFAATLKAIKSGMRDIDLTAIAQHEGQVRGSEQGIFLGCSSPLGLRASFVPRSQQGRSIREGDHFTLLIENNGPGGFYTEIARTIVLGKASNELIDGFEAVKEAQHYSLSLIKPGAACRDIAAAHDDYMRSRKLPPERRLYAHGQGYDMVERPLIRRDETMAIQAGMNLAVHPGYETPSLFAVICDNFLVGADGSIEWLHKTDQKVFEI